MDSRKKLSFTDFDGIEPVAKGMSGDEKFCVTTSEGKRYLLRLSDRGQWDRKQVEFALMQTAHAHGARVSVPLAFGEFEDGRVYQLTEWCEGTDLEELLPRLGTDDARSLGQRAGCFLRKIHAIAGPEAQEPWEIRFSRKIAARQAEIAEYGPDCADVRRFLDYLQENIGILAGRPQCFNHGDFNSGNLILLADGELAAIDFNGYNLGYGDPLFEMSVIWLDDGLPEAFRQGFAEGYFPEGSPENLGRIMEFYHIYGLLAALCEEEDTEEVLKAIHSAAEKL